MTLLVRRINSKNLDWEIALSIQSDIQCFSPKLIISICFRHQMPQIRVIMLNSIPLVYIIINWTNKSFIAYNFTDLLNISVKHEPGLCYRNDMFRKNHQIRTYRKDLDNPFGFSLVSLRPGHPLNLKNFFLTRKIFHYGIIFWDF